MARVKLDLPEHFVYTTDIPVYISYVNYGGHLGHDALLSLLHEARVRFLRAHGYHELDIEGRGLIIADAVIVYKSEAFHGDTLVVEIALADFTRYGCDICYKVSKQGEGVEVARAKTGIVFFDYQARRPTDVPESFRQRFAGV